MVRKNLWMWIDFKTLPANARKFPESCCFHKDHLLELISYKDPPLFAQYFSRIPTFLISKSDIILNNLLIRSALIWISVYCAEKNNWLDNLIYFFSVFISLLNKQGLAFCSDWGISFEKANFQQWITFFSRAIWNLLVGI